MSLNDGMDMTSEYVIGTYSYTPADWVEMNMLMLVTTVTQSTKILDKLADYLWKYHNVNYGDFFQTLVDTLLRDTRVDSTVQKNFNAQLQALFDWLYDNSHDTYCDYDPEFPFTMSPPVYLLFITLIDIDKFFDAVLLTVEKLTPVDDRIIDLCEYSKNTVIDITYRPGRTFTTKFDWLSYVSTGILEEKTTNYQINDTQMIAGGKWYDIDWEQYQGLRNYYTHYVYRACYDHRSSVYAFNIVEI